MVDVTLIQVTAGKGGDGAVSFRREKYVPKGGPDGGDGGNGGDVTLKLNPNDRTLDYFAPRESFKAEPGGRGQGSRKKGKDGQDLTLPAPAGTDVWQITSPEPPDKTTMISWLKNTKLGKTDQPVELLGTITKDSNSLTLARGGQGGRGNDHFKSSSNQTPRYAEPGRPGQTYWLALELKLLADIGIIGLPNAGKSTLISVLTNARPKIADYQFTTLEPNLGVIKFDSKPTSDSDGVNELILADIPGLIEGASSGKGLGDDFLRHVERCRGLIHLIAPRPELLTAKPEELTQALITDYHTIRQELTDYGAGLNQKPETIVINKLDLLSDQLTTHITKAFKSAKLDKPIFVSAATHDGLDQLKQTLHSN